MDPGWGLSDWEEALLRCLLSHDLRYACLRLCVCVNTFFSPKKCHCSTKMFPVVIFSLLFAIFLNVIIVFGIRHDYACLWIGSWELATVSGCFVSGKYKSGGSTSPTKANFINPLAQVCKYVCNGTLSACRYMQKQKGYRNFPPC